VAPVYAFDVPLAASPQASAAGLQAGCGSPSGVTPYRDIKDISFSGGWNTVIGIPIGVQAAVHFTAGAGLNVTGGLGLSCKLSVGVFASGMAGPIPVTAGIAGELHAFAGVGGILNTGGSLHVDAGAKTVGVPPLLVWLPQLSFSEPRFTFGVTRFAQATAGIGVAVKLGIGNGNIASATLNLGSSVDFGAQPGSCTWDARFGQFSAEGQIAGWSIETPKTPALFTKQLWHNNCGGVGGGGGGGVGGGGVGGVGGVGTWSPMSAPTPQGPSHVTAAFNSTTARLVACHTIGNCVALGSVMSADGTWGVVIDTESSGSWSEQLAPLPADARRRRERRDGGSV
jgi:hypothetical protein